MTDRSKIASLSIALFVTFLDFMGIAIIWPIFSPMLFDPTLPLLSSDTSPAMRGFWLGLLLSLSPLSQFFSSAVWGAVSDGLGRKKPLQWSLTVSLVGNVCGFAGVFFNSLAWILLSRIVIGMASGNFSIVQATIADISSPEEKTKNFGLVAMMIGLGFTIGPLIGGLLSYYGYSTPFIFATLFAVLNLIFAIRFFQETLHQRIATKINWRAGIDNLKKAFVLEGMGTIFLAFFLGSVAWDFFVEFIPVYLISHFQFSSADIGRFFAVGSGAYALNSGYLIRPVSKWLRAETLFFGGMLLGGLFIFAMLLHSSSWWLWSMTIFMFYFSAFISPSCSTLISNRASNQIQGEALGVMGSVNGIAVVCSSLFSGSLVGAYPTSPIWGGGAIMLAAALVGFFVFRKPKI
jgi:MFS transporter, DHA1 family, tetracycline resistance protein